MNQLTSYLSVEKGTILKLMFFLLLPIFLFQSCTKEDTPNEEVVQKSSVISNSNLLKLKREALKIKNNLDFSVILNPDLPNSNHEEVLNILNRQQQQNNINYKEVLGDYYNEEYFNHLSDLLDYSKNIISSNLFEENSTIEQREVYLIDILTYVFLENSNQTTKNTSNCLAYYNSCKSQAKRDHGTRLINCTAIATVASLGTGGAGALTWPICMVTSGYLYSSAMTGCSEAYDICRQQQ